MTDVSTIRSIIEMSMRSKNMSVDEAAKLVGSMAKSPDDVIAAVESILTDAKRQQLLEVPRGVTKLDYQHLLDDVRGQRWYTGPLDHDKHWPPLLAEMADSMGHGVATSVDQASTKVVSLLGDPGIHQLTKKGLVLGYVQSGKTANYAAVLAKAADAGFRLFIVLSGIHNALRSQTQARLNRDLVEPHQLPWVLLTTTDEDFGAVAQGPGLLSAKELRNLVVIKKNASRLERLRAWLADIPEAIRIACPAIIIDDEADQATPNSLAGKQAMSKINELTQEIFKLLPSATYIGYTATPFANVLIDPNAEDDFYPSDFILDLPRPDSYFGAEALFGRDSLSEDEEPVDGLDMIRRITPADALKIGPPPKTAADAEAFEATLPDSLQDAVLWFIIAVAARWERGQRAKHTSMLVHTSQLVAQHSIGAKLVRDCVEEFRTDSSFMSKAEEMWLAESARVPSTLFDRKSSAFSELRPFIPEVLAELKIIIDNGSSEDRLNYEEEEAQTVIAVGGQTLSRGLTLEGLTVSYFMRTSKTYDTLLQMGRWFGFRTGYEELPRVWLTREMESNFRDLATIEQEIRDDIANYERDGVTPRQLGLRIRRHPAMAVTAASKMTFATQVQLSFAGCRRQTFRFDAEDAALQIENVDRVRKLVADMHEDGLAFSNQQGNGSKWVARDVPAGLVTAFLREFKICQAQPDLQPELTTAYLDLRVDEAARLWNVAIVGSSKETLVSGQEIFTPGSIDLGLERDVLMVNRAPLADVEGPANIKALMSTPDSFLDLHVTSAEKKNAGSNHEDLRQVNVGGRGLLLIYPISGNSRPIGEKTIARTCFPEPSIDMIGLGIIFPSLVEGDDSAASEEHDYVGLPQHLMPGAPDALDEEEAEAEAEASMLADDSEASADIDGTSTLNNLSGNG